MGQIDNNNFIIKDDGTIVREAKANKSKEKNNNSFSVDEDGTIVRKQKLERLKKQLTDKKSDETVENNSTTDDNVGCLSIIKTLGGIILVTSLIGGVIGYFVNGYDGFKAGLVLGGAVGILLIYILGSD